MNCKSNRAYSLTQILVTLGISGILLAGVGLLISNLLKGSAIEKSKAELLEHHRFVSQKVRDLLNTAIKVDGATVPSLPGIARWDNATQTLAAPRVGDQNDEVIFHVHPNIYAVPLTGAVQSIGDPVTAVQATFTNEVPGNDEAHNVHRYFEQVANDNSKAFYSITTSNASNLYIRDVNTPPQLDGNRITLNFLPPQSPATFNADEHVQTSNFMRSATRYELFINDEDQLILRRKQRPDGDGTEEVIAPRVIKLQADYLFGENENFPLEPIIPEDYLSHPKDPDYYGGASPCTPELEAEGRCVEWDNIVNVRLMIDIASDTKVPNDLQFRENSGFRVVDGRLVFRSFISMVPTAFDPFRLSSNPVDSQTCSLADPYTKCNPACSHVFQGQNPVDPDWEVYGDMASNYCQCGIKAADIANDGRDFIPPDFSEIYDIVSWTSGSEHQSAISSCVAHYGACHAQWKHEDPRAKIICSCIFDGEGTYQTGYPSNYQYQNLASLELEMGSASPTVPLKCAHWQMCKNNVNAWLSPDPSPNAFTEVCGCLFYNLDADGNPTETPIAQKQYSRLCSVSSCPDNFQNVGGIDHPKLRQVGGPDQRFQGFSLHEAAACQCAGDIYSTLGAQPGQEYRQPRQPSDPVPLHNDSNEAGSLTSVLRDIVYVEGEGTTPQTMPRYSCSLAQCATLGTSVGCCITENPPGQFSGAGPSFPNHGSYCSNKCRSPEDHTNPSQTNSVRRVILFGADSGQDLPWWCGGAGGGGGGGGSVGN